MRVLLVTPAPRGSRTGNRVTALRWTGILRSLGHHVVVAAEIESLPLTGSFDLLVALHARRSARAVERFFREQPDAPRIVALTGTDVYQDLVASPAASQATTQATTQIPTQAPQPEAFSKARAALQLASRIIVLQPLAAQALPLSLAERVRTIYQSAPSRVAPAHVRSKDAFTVCVLGHLRPVKDPFRTALAARLLPPSSRLRVVHVGGALSDDMAEAARAEERDNPRYRWLGERSRGQAIDLVSASDLLSLTSTMEGGANAISEAIAAAVPIVCTRIDGSVGLLGPDYPGYFPVGQTEALAVLLDRCENDADFLASLAAHGARLRPLFHPDQERASWQALLAELFPS